MRESDARRRIMRRSMIHARGLTACVLAYRGAPRGHAHAPTTEERPWMTRRRTTTKQLDPHESWSAYVRAHMDPDERQVDVAHRSGIDQTTVSRWLNGGPRSVISSQSVARFARAHGRPVLEA